MKNKSLLSLLVLAILLFSISCKDEAVVPPQNLPENLPRFISTHFPDQLILQSIRDYDDITFSYNYEILLSGFVTLEFTKNGEIKKISARSEIPSLAIPMPQIVKKAKELFPNAYILAWESDDQNQELRLSNGITLEFTKSGDFMRIDN